MDKNVITPDEVVEKRRLAFELAKGDPRVERFILRAHKTPATSGA